MQNVCNKKSTYEILSRKCLILNAPQSLFISNQITKNLESLSELSDFISYSYNQNIFK